MEKPNQRVTLTKRLLKEGLLRLLEKKTIDKVNVTELCREAGINRATFYTHYETPHDLLLEIEQDMAREMKKLQREAPAQDIQTGVELLCRYLYDHADLVRLLMRNFSDHDLYQMINTSYQDIIRSAVAKGVDREDVRLITTYLAGGGYALLVMWLQEDIQKTPREIAALITSLFSDSLLNLY